MRGILLNLVLVAVNIGGLLVNPSFASLLKLSFIPNRATPPSEHDPMRAQELREVYSPDVYTKKLASLVKKTCQNHVIPGFVHKLGFSAEQLKSSFLFMKTKNGIRYIQEKTRLDQFMMANIVKEFAYAIFPHQTQEIRPSPRYAHGCVIKVECLYPGYEIEIIFSQCHGY